MGKKILVTGAAGFVGAATCEYLLKQGNEVVGVDVIDDYYNVKLKEYRLSLMQENDNFTFRHLSITDKKALSTLFKEEEFSAVINMAARAGVRYSIENPYIYVDTNITGLVNLLEEMKAYEIKKLVHASSSSVYAENAMPFQEEMNASRPLSPYAATKKAGEEIAYAYHHLYGIDVSMLRYFTVYGPASRPDMGIFRFVKRIANGEAIELYGDGSQGRDFTYIGDIAEGNVKALKEVGYEVFNLGFGEKPTTIMEIIKGIEKLSGKQAIIKEFPFNRADMKNTWADIGKAQKILDWTPKTGIEAGLKQTVEWYNENEAFVKTL